MMGHLRDSCIPASLAPDGTDPSQICASTDVPYYLATGPTDQYDLQLGQQPQQSTQAPVSSAQPYGPPAPGTPEYNALTPGDVGSSPSAATQIKTVIQKIFVPAPAVPGQPQQAGFLSGSILGIPSWLVYLAGAGVAYKLLKGRR